jgi:molecular chaperone DnaK (HSP70)
MRYVLGIDVGNGQTTAAICRHDSGDTGGAIVLPLDEGSPSVHSVLYLSGDDTVLVGRDALAMAESDPERLARGLVARVGDPIAPLLGGRPCPAEMLLASLVCWVVDRAVDHEQEEPERVVLTHPASWGPHRRSVLDNALRQAGLADVLLLPKPLAAAESHLAGHPLATGDAVAVYDLGEETVSGAVARLGPAGFDLLGRAETGEQVGGGHFDDVLTGHVLGELGRTDLDPFDEELRPAIAELRADCRVAKETLSVAAETIIPTPRLGPPSSVLVTRAQFEQLISPAINRTVDTLLTAIRPGDKLTAVVLVGGSARVPLVAELIGAATAPTPVVTDPDPATAVARGAALAGWRPGAPVEMNTAEPVRLPDQRDRADGVDAVDLDAPTQPPRPPVEVAPLDVPRRRWKVASRSRRRTG